MSKKKVAVMSVDTGGTMTDTFFVDENGEFAVGKAQTTPEDESVGFVDSCEDALGYWDMQSSEVFPSIMTGVYSGTAMINRLLERKGSRVGVITTAGHEDVLRMERAVQPWLGLSYADRVHITTHAHHTPLVPIDRIRGVRGRIGIFGDEIIPLYEHEVRQAVGELLEQGIEALVVSLIFSWRNPSHELKVGEIAQDIMKERGAEIPIFLSCEYYPVERDFPRLNTVVVEAYAADPSRGQLRFLQNRVNEFGGRFPLRIMSGHGGTSSIEVKQLARSIASGPIGGLVGGAFIGRELGISNLVCTDIGGTSFDVGLVSDGAFFIKTLPNVEWFLLCTPMAEINSVGAGTGSFVRVNPAYQRLELGPDSAGFRIGVCWKEGGIETVTVTDCHLVLGFINPDYFLGGEVKLDKQRAYDAIKDQIADKLGLNVYEAAWAIIEILETQLRAHLATVVTARGFSPLNFSLLVYGGGGPLHAAGLAREMGFQSTLVPTWAAGFSAFGCAAADFEYRGEHSVSLPLPAGASEQDKLGIGEVLNRIWGELRDGIAAEFEKSGRKRVDVKFKNLLRMQYIGQLEDIEVNVKADRIQKAQDVDEIIDEYEQTYGRVYAKAARSPEVGYFITRVIALGSAEVEKPRLPKEELAGHEPAKEASKGEREVYYRGQWFTAKIWDMDRLSAGNRVKGIAVVEAPATTFMIPPGYEAELSPARIFYLKEVR